MPESNAPTETQGETPDEDAAIEEEPSACKCGTKHSQQPRNTADDLVRLALTLASNELRSLVLDTIFRGLTRTELDDPNREDPWQQVCNLFMDDEFQPEMPLDDAHLHTGKELHPELPPLHTRTPAILKTWTQRVKKELTVWNNKYQQSGQNDPDKRWDFVANGNKAYYAFWLILDTAGILDGFVRLLEEDAQAEEGIDGSQRPNAKSKKQPHHKKRDSSNASSSHGEEERALLKGAAQFLCNQNAPTVDLDIQNKKAKVDMLVQIAGAEGVDQKTKDLSNTFLQTLMMETFSGLIRKIPKTRSITQRILEQ
eukprot:1181490-Prorocentrum_minimum.AAC.1